METLELYFYELIFQIHSHGYKDTYNSKRFIIARLKMTLTSVNRQKKGKHQLDDGIFIGVIPCNG